MSIHSFPALSVHIDRRDWYSLVRCSGRAVLECGLERLEAVGVRELAARRRVILDLEGVTQIDARGLGVLARLCQAGLLYDRPVVIVGAAAHLRRIMQLTRLDSVIGRVDSTQIPLDPPAGALFACR